MLTSPDDLREMRLVADTLTRLGIPYAIGGSVASSVLGIMRFTQDADFSVEPFAGKEAAFAACFDANRYLSVPAMKEAIRLRRSFNIINTTTGSKVDLFVRKDRPFEISAMQRRRPYEFPDLPEQPLFILSPEDVVLFKLEWYRLGNEVSERQWTDVLNVLRVQAAGLDSDYLKHWATQLGVHDLLERALQQATAVSE
jgi:hypothetical protein